MALTIHFLGHSGFVLDDGTYRLAIDPFLTGNPVAVDSAESLDVTHIALTHGHSDHIGDTVAIAQRTGAPVVATFEICSWLGERGVTATQPGNPGGTIRVPFGQVTFTQAFHSSSIEGRYMGVACGLVVAMGGVTFYHAGDTGLFGDMKLLGDIYRPDIAAIPIGDRFTMGPELASRAADFIGAPTVIPIHYATFPPLVQTADAFRPTVSAVRVMTPGERWEVNLL